MNTKIEKSFSSVLLSGSIAGLSVDLALFPLDAIKTRLQSSRGFLVSGAYKSIYRGLSTAAVGSVPSAAVFFSAYEIVKKYKPLDSSFSTINQAFAASCAETVTCLVRVPTEVIKQRSIVSKSQSSFNILVNTYKSEGFLGFYRGYFTTVLREIPFSIVQFPVWEILKKFWGEKQNHDVFPWQSSICGAVAGGIAAAVTTPLDVAKTRIMLAKHDSVLSKGNLLYAFSVIYQQRGFSGFFDGITPRVLLISFGGAIFLGIYDKVLSILHFN